MLNILLGTDWTANRDEILRLIADDVKQKKGGRILMVPELISHDMERRLCSTAGDTASRFAEVLSFTRLARRVADSVGSAAEACLDDGGRLVAMASAARQLHSKLKAYASVETRPEFLTELLDAVDEFKRCCITAQDLKTASLQSEGSLAQKLEELSLLLESYDAICQRGKRDPRDQMNWLLEQLEDGDFAQRHTFYIDGFPDFTRQHFAILEHLLSASPCVTVSLNCDKPDTHVLAFEKAGSTAFELIRSAKRLGIPVNIRSITPHATVLEPVRRGLFQGKIDPEDSLREKLLLRRTESVYDECQSAAERVFTLVGQGSRFRDIGIACADMTGYRDILRLIFHQYRIPLYLSGTEDILSKSVVNTVLSALEAALGGFEQQAVIRYLKSVLSPLSVDMVDLIENYAIVWSIRGSRWQGIWENHPDGLGAIWDDDARERLQALNEAKALAMTPLLRLSRSFQRSTVLKEQTLALAAFLEDIDLSRRLGVMADSLDSAGDNRAAQILNQLWEILLGALEQLYDVLGETIWDGNTFVRLLKLLLSQYDVGTIPTVLDAVTAGPVSAMRCHQVKHLIVLGALEGALPGYGGSKGVLTDQERVALREMGVPLTGGSMEGLQAEFSEIYGVFCGAGESILVSYPGGQPSYVYKRLCGLVCGDKGYVSTLGAAVADPKAAGALLAGFGEEMTAERLGVSQWYHETLRHTRYRLGKITPRQITRLYGQRLRLSASQVDKQADCRFAYFMKYGLRANERKEATVDPAEFGSYVHAVLEQTARRVMELGGFHQVSLGETMELAMTYSEAYARERFSQLDSKRMTYLFQRNVWELQMVVRELWQELNASAFEPVGFEISFGDDKDMPAISIPSRTILAQLRGFVDRVDVWRELGRNYFRVVDYKTGRKDFDYCDVFNGLGLQMFLYLFALEQGGESLLGKDPIPAGVQYFPARCPVMSAEGNLTTEEADSERGKTLKRRGLLLADADVLNAMEPEGAPKRLSCSIKKDGTMTGDMADRDQMKLLKAYIFRLLGKMVDEIASGCVDPNPYTRGSSHNACGYCPYKAVCSDAAELNRRDYKAMSAQKFWEEIRKEMSGNG